MTATETPYETELPLSDGAVEAFRRDGAIAIRNLIDAQGVETLRSAVDWSMANPGDYALDFASGAAGASFFGDVFVWTRNPDYAPVVVNERLGKVAGRLMGAQSVRFYFDHLLVKEPGSAAPTPWHQDAPYWPMSGRMCCSIWVALDPVSRQSGAVEYVRGSHAWGKSYAPESFKGDDRLQNETLEKLPDIDADRGAFDLLSWDLAPGDVAVHHCMTLHGAPANETAETRRRGLALRFIGEDIRYDERPGMPEPMTGYLSQLAPELQIDDVYEGRWFPELWHANT